jgi:hypothetical protein
MGYSTVATIVRAVLSSKKSGQFTFELLPAYRGWRVGPDVIDGRTPADLLAISPFISAGHSSPHWLGMRVRPAHNVFQGRHALANDFLLRHK